MLIISIEHDFLTGIVRSTIETEHNRREQKENRCQSKSAVVQWRMIPLDIFYRCFVDLFLSYISYVHRFRASLYMCIRFSSQDSIRSDI
jgi:hypothetical protein